MKRRYLSGARLARWLTRHNRFRLAAKRAGVKLKVVVLKHRRVELSGRALKLAAHYVGTKESPAGSNVTMFGKWYGENGVRWCAIFVSFVLSHAGRPFRWAYVPAIVAAAKAEASGLSVIPVSKVNATIRAGHPVLACFDWEKDGTADHVGLVDRVDATHDTVHTIEGNTGSSDWSNGGEVLREVRPVGLVQAFVKVA
jgi:hypothetical protein